MRKLIRYIVRLVKQELLEVNTEKLLKQKLFKTATGKLVVYRLDPIGANQLVIKSVYVDSDGVSFIEVI